MPVNKFKIHLFLEKIYELFDQYAILYHRFEKLGYALNTHKLHLYWFSDGPLTWNLVHKKILIRSPACISIRNGYQGGMSDLRIWILGQQGNSSQSEMYLPHLASLPHSQQMALITVPVASSCIPSSHPPTSRQNGLTMISRLFRGEYFSLFPCN